MLGVPVAIRAYSHGERDCSDTMGISRASPIRAGPKWLGLLCRIELAGVGSGVIADLRALPADASTSIAEEAKETSGGGKVSLVIPDEELEGERAHLVLVSPAGQILAQREVVVGRNR